MNIRIKIGVVIVLLVGCLSIAGCRADDDEIPAEIEVSFYGESCDTTAPEELPVGKYQFILKDLSRKFPSELYVARITGEHSYQELLDPQEEPGQYYPKPDWLIYALKIGKVGSGIPEDEKHYTVTFEAGEHAIYIATSLPEGGWGLWFCTPLMVAE
jgi:hypothetical protein